MQHVGKRLNMHQAMFNGNVEQSIKRKTIPSATVRFQTSIRQFLVQSSAYPAHIIAHKFERRPVRRPVGRQSPTHRVNPKRKQSIKLGMKAFQPKDVLMQQVPIERLEVPYVKNDAVTLWDGPLINRVGPDDIKKGVAPSAGIGDPFQELLPDNDISLSSKHWTS
jgi:hypothetical protein